MARTTREHAHKKATGPRQARGRFVSRSTATSEQLASVSFHADYLFRACIPFLDVAGRMTGNPALIKSQVVPLRDEISSRNLPELLRELAGAVDHEGIPLVFWYEINGAKVLEFPGFAKHQTGLRVDRESPSKLPQRNGMEKLLQNAGASPDKLRSNAGVGPAQDEVEVEVEGEVEGEVVKSEARANQPPQSVASPANSAPSPTVQSRTAFTETSTLATALETLVGPDHWPPIFAFLQRREYRTWSGWLREMAKLVGPGSQFTADDLASVCADDEALTEPISSPYGLRVFLGTRRRERTSGVSGSNAAANGPAANGASGRTMPTQRLALGESTYAAALAATEDLDDSGDDELGERIDAPSTNPTAQEEP